MDWEGLSPFATAIAVGLMIGLEREHAQRGQPASRIAGSRTFAVLSLGGAVTAALGIEAVAAGLLAVGVLLAVGYLRTGIEDAGLTTEVAALAAYGIGALAWDAPQYAIAVAVALTVLLASKERLHHLAREVITDVEIQDALKFFVIAFVVLPLLPTRDLGPYGVLNPSRIWTLVVVLTGVSWAGYVGTRWLGPERGLVVTGFGGGLVSASATTAQMARLARREPRKMRAALSATLAASVATVSQLGVILGLTKSELLRPLLPILVATGTVLLGEAVFLSRRRKPQPSNGSVAASEAGSSEAGSPEAGSAPEANRPFSFWPAVTLVVLLTAVLLVARWGSDQFGARGTIAAAGIAGGADVHAPVLAIASLLSAGELDSTTALTAVLVALLTNTATKVTFALILGRWTFAWRFITLLLPAIAAGAAALFLT